MVTGVKKDTGNVIYMRLKKHCCPECGSHVSVVRMKKVVRSKTRAAKGFDFDVCDASLGERVKFIWYEFRCRECKKQFTEAHMKEYERQRKKELKKQEKTQNKAK